jgi:hypothetical protein
MLPYTCIYSTTFRLPHTLSYATHASKMLLLTPLVILFNYIWLATQLLITRIFDATRHILLSLLSFPAYVLDSLKEGVMNWYKFFFVDLPLYFDTFLEVPVYFEDTIAGLYEDIMDKVEGANFYLSITLPSSFHETFGHPIDDLSPEDWKYARLCVLGFLLYLFICFCYKNYNSSSPAAPYSPIIMTEEVKNEMSDLSSNIPAPSPSHSPAKPFDLGHFYTPNFFTTPAPYTQD